MTTFTLEFFANSKPDPSGFGEGKRFLDSVVVVTDSSGLATVTRLFLESDRFISATSTDSAGNTSEFSMVDTDGDALADSWEVFFIDTTGDGIGDTPMPGGIDINEDGTIDLFLGLSGADPNHKDVFVEVDAMQGRAPLPDTLTTISLGRIDPRDSTKRLDEGFANAPADLVQNPDGDKGINLHFEMDPGDTNIRRFGFTSTDAFDDFDMVKNGGWEPTHPNGRFGTPFERSLPNWPQIREARRLVYRYVVFADTQSGGAQAAPRFWAMI